MKKTANYLDIYPFFNQYLLNNHSMPCSILCIRSMVMGKINISALVQLSLLGRQLISSKHNK